MTWFIMLYLVTVAFWVNPRNPRRDGHLSGSGQDYHEQISVSRE